MTGQLSHTISEIADSLSFSERKTFLYLSGVEKVIFGTGDIRDVLSSVTNVEHMDVFLMELMFKMRRFDILKKVLRVSRTEVEEMLKTVQFVSDYRVLMADIDDNIGTEDLRSIVFLLSSSLPRERLDGIQSFLDILTELEKRGEVSSESMDLIEQCLRSIHRMDLVNKINQYKKKVAATQGQSTMSNHTSGVQLLRKSVPESNVNPVVSNEKWELPRLYRNTKISVTESERMYHQNSLDVYRMQAKPRGVCVIIDCVGNDGDQLEQTFRCLHFHVILRKLLSVTDCLSTLREVAQLSHHGSADAFACCVISRGSESHLLGTESQGPGLSLVAVRHLFDSFACPGLAGKPKLFFIQSYSVFEPQRSSGCSGYYSYWDEYLDTDVPAMACGHTSIPTSADVFWSHCWAPHRALEEQNHQSAYLQAVQSALLNGQTKKRNFLDVHVEVNQKIYEHNERNPTGTYGLDVKHTLRKMLFLS